MKIYKAIISVFFLLIVTAVKAQSNNEASSLDSSNLTFQRVLSLEICIPNTYSFCDGGYHMPFKYAPILVKLNEDNFFDSYDDTVFLFTYPDYNDTFIHTIITNHNDSDYIKIELPRRYKQNIRKEIRRGKLRVDFDGCYRYLKRKFSIDCVYLGEGLVSVPNPNFKTDRRSFIDKKCKRFRIISIELVGSSQN